MTEPPDQTPSPRPGDPVQLDMEGAIRAKVIDPEDADALQFHLQKLAERRGALSDLPQELLDLLLRVMSWSMAIDPEAEPPANHRSTTLH